MKIKRALLPVGVFMLFGMSAGLMAKSINSSNDIKQVKADTADVTISTDAEFANFISAVNGGTRYDNELVQLAADVSYEITAKPTAAEPYSIFAGTFDGLNHTITITVNLAESMPSLFRNLGNGDFKNAVFKNTNINYSITSCLTTGKVYAAPVATYNNGLIQNVHSTISYDEQDVTYIGGIVEKNQAIGQAIGIIEDCSVNGSIRAKGYIGGIASENLGIIRNCVNNCALTSAGAYAGGITAINGTSGFVKAKIINCVNNANISSTGTDLGGIAGFQYSNSETSYCDNYGSITSTSTKSGYSYGGIIGRIDGADSNADHATKVEYCYNAGNLSTIKNAGGIIGMVNSGATPAVQVSGCFTTGNVNVTTANGGTLIGWSNSNNLILNDTHAAGAKSGVTTLGIGGGNAKATTTSVADGVSDDFRAIIKAIREYNCAAIPGFNTLYNGLVDSEKTLLDEINYYDDINTYAMKTYGQAAEYIIQYIIGNQAYGARIPLLNLDNNYCAVIIVISVMVFSITLMMFVIRRKKHVANK